MFPIELVDVCILAGCISQLPRFLARIARTGFSKAIEFVFKDDERKERITLYPSSVFDQGVYVFVTKMIVEMGVGFATLRSPELLAKGGRHTGAFPDQVCLPRTV
jgi:hypothetical protein